MKRYIRAASDSESPLKTSMDELEADFDYIMNGLEKLSRMGADKEKEALSVALELSSMLTEINNEISNLIIE